jgi:uracil-DNA glycosylase family 4
MSETRTDKLRQIRDEILALEASPLYEFRKSNGYYPVIGQGSHEAKIMFIGEAPGKNEAETGRPFCGASGRVLDELLASVNIKREDVYVTNIVKDRPPDNRDPQRAEIDLYAPFLDRQIEIIQPQVIATLGRFSMEFILKRFDSPHKGGKISKLHGQLLEATASYGSIFVLPLYHPAVALYTASKKPELMEDFKQLQRFVSES